MPSALSYRLAKLEEKLPKPQRKGGRVIRMVASEKERDEAYKLALAEGFDPSDDSDDILIIHLVALTPSGEGYRKPPQILSASGISGR
jgi:hypothetical protein